ncbi:hypothetical protein FPV67DRAFT_1421991, partial [Lyophyllum atratum]
ILSQNMWQTTTSAADSAFRTALKNMRYASCTDADIVFLKSWVANLNDSNTPMLNTLPFRNASIITARNLHKGQLNSLGTEQFATDHE